jgi:ribosomal protein L30/L7E
MANESNKTVKVRLVRGLIAKVHYLVRVEE